MSDEKGSSKGEDNNNGVTPQDIQELQSQIDKLNKENESLKKSNQDLTSQRDKNHEAMLASNEEVQQFVSKAKLEEAVDKFMSENQSDYPDVTKADLMKATSTDDIEAVAKGTQSKLEELEQRALEKVQKVGSKSTMSDDDYKERLEKLKNSNDPNAFEKMLEVRATKTGYDLSR